MTTTLSPSVGAGIAFTQQGQGTSPGYSALDLRRSDSLGLQEGVYNASDFMVVQRGAGANMSVDIGMPAGGFACVQGDTISGQGLYTVPVHSATINETIAAADATNPRVDQVILEVLDNVHDGSGGNRAQTRVLTGTATAGATLANRTGAAALPGNALLLADVLVSAGAGSIANNAIRDRRKWARGAYVRIVRSSADYTTSTSTAADIDGTNLAPRVECSGSAYVRVSLRCECNLTSSTLPKFILAFLNLDGVTTLRQSRRQFYTSNRDDDIDAFWEVAPAAGSHVFKPQFSIETGATLGTLYANAGTPLEFTVEEIVRQNSANNTTTTG